MVHSDVECQTSNLPELGAHGGEVPVHLLELRRPDPPSKAGELTTALSVEACNPSSWPHDVQRARRNEPKKADSCEVILRVTSVTATLCAIARCAT